jgi:1-acyl-sn-glycerol-3-phosphate acyltransferase
MMTWLRSLLFAVIFYALSLLYVLAALLIAPFGAGPLAWVATQWAWFHRGCARWLLGQRVVLEGAVVRGPYLYVVKHESMFETIDMLCLFDRPVIAAKQELLDMPLWGWVATRYGLIGVRREAGASALRALRAAAREAVAKGQAICLFPEGTRTPHGARPPLRPGFAGLYGLLGIPVVPIAVDSGRLSPRGAFRKRGGVITYRFGAIIPPGLPRAEAEARVHAAINALNA